MEMDRAECSHGQMMTVVLENNRAKLLIFGNSPMNSLSSWFAISNPDIEKLEAVSILSLTEVSSWVAFSFVCFCLLFKEVVAAPLLFFKYL